MKTLHLCCHSFSIGTAAAILVACGGGQGIPQPPAGGPQDVPIKSGLVPLSGSLSHLHSQYKLVDTGTLGGPNDSLGFEGERNLNDAGQLVELADLAGLSSPPFCFPPPPDCHVAHAALWSQRKLRDLGSLADGYSGGPIWISNRGQVSGFAQTGQLDPLTNSPQFHAVLYSDGRVVDLGTLGGYESAAGGINDAGLVSGCATTKKSDPYGFCFTTQVSRAVIWRDRKIHDLGTLGGPDAQAQLVNDRGDVVGWSLTDNKVNPSTGIPTQHPFLWRNGKMHDLGTIGGTACGFNILCANDINERGEFVGGMNIAGDQSFHPFLWNGTTLKDLGTLGGAFGQANWINDKGSVVGWAWNDQGNTHAFFWNGAMHDIGTLAGDSCSAASGVNSRGQTVGGSYPDVYCSAASSRAFLYERGEIVDLNQLIDSNHRAQLTVALTINERGEIAAQGMFPNGDIHGFLLIPTGHQQAPKAVASAWKMPPSLTLPNRPTQNGLAGIIAAFRAHRYYSRFSVWHAAGGFSP